MSIPARFALVVFAASLLSACGGDVLDLPFAPPDADKDGVEDRLDQCPNTPAQIPVDATGCSLPPPPTRAFFGTPAPLPGVIEAEAYDTGGQNLGYFDTTAGNTGQAFRTDDVDIEPRTGGGFNVGYVAAGEWLEYSVTVTEPSAYRVYAKVASAATADHRLRLSFRGQNAATAEMAFSATGGWQQWAKSPSKVISLTPGQQTLRLEVLSGEFNVDAIVVEKITPVISQPLLEAYAGYTGEYPGFKLAIDERFNSFDSNLWARGDGAVGNEADCRFQPQGVEVVDGILQFVIRKENIAAGFSLDHQKDKRAYGFSCGELRTNAKFRYGRLETRFHTPVTPATGFISSLFTYDMSPTYEWREIDIEVEGRRPGKMQSNLIFGNNSDVYHYDWGATRNWGAWEDATHVTPRPLSQWIVYAIEWTPNYIAWFMDGVEVRRLTNAYLAAHSPAPNSVNMGMPAHIPTNATQIMMNFWIPTPAVGPGFGGDPAGNQYPMVAEYDWFRYYEYVP